MRKLTGAIIFTLFMCSLSACSFYTGRQNESQTSVRDEKQETENTEEINSREEADNVEEENNEKEVDSQEESVPSENDSTEETESVPAVSIDLPDILAGRVTETVSRYTDQNGDVAAIPAGFKVSDKTDEQTISKGLVVIGPDGSEFVWVPTNATPLAVREFGSYFYGGDISTYYDETDLPEYQEMLKCVNHYGGFYMGRYEASYGGGSNVDDYVPASKRVTETERGSIWVQFSPQNTTVACQNLYADNDTVQGFFPWGINWDTTLQWLIDSGCKSEEEVVSDSTNWGNYSDDPFSENANGKFTGKWEETKANNIYDLAGNNWEWTQERNGGGNYVMRGGGYNLMGGACPGDSFPAALRDPLPGNDHHPNVTFRVALYVK